MNPVKKVLVKVYKDGKLSARYRFNVTTTFKKMFDDFCEKRMIETNKLKFMYGNRELQATDTMETCGANVDEIMLIHVQQIDSSPQMMDDENASKQPLKIENDQPSAQIDIPSGNIEGSGVNVTEPLSMVAETIEQNQQNVEICHPITVEDGSQNSDSNELASNAKTGSDFSDVDECNQDNDVLPIEPMTQAQTIAIECNELNEDELLNNSPLESSDKENEDVIIVKNPSGNENPLKRKPDDKLSSPMVKICKVTPVNQQSNMSLTERKKIKDDALRKIEELEQQIKILTALTTESAPKEETISLERHREIINEMTENHTSLINQLKEKHREAIDTINAEKDFIIDNNCQGIELMKGSLELKFHKKLENVKLEHKSEIEKLRETHQCELRLKDDMHAKTLRELKTIHEMTLEKLINDKKLALEEQSKHLKKEREELIETLEKKHQHELHSVKIKLNKIIVDSKREHVDEIKKIQESQKIHMDEIKQLNNNVVDQMQINVEKVKAFYVSEIDRLNDKIKEMKEKQINDIQSSEKTISELRMELALLKSKQKTGDTNETIAQLKQQLHEQKQAFTEELQKKKKLHTDNILQNIKRFDQIKMKMKREMDAQAENHMKEVSIFQKKIEILKEQTQGGGKFAEKYENLMKSYEKLSDKLNQLKQEYEDTVQGLNTKLLQKQQQIDQMEKLIDQQKLQYENDLQSKAKTIEGIQENNAELARQNSHLKNEIETYQNLNTEREISIIQWKTEISKLYEQIEQLKEHEQNLTGELNRLKGIEDSHKYLADLHPKLNADISNLTQSHKQLEETLADKERALSELKQYHKETMDRLNAEKKDLLIELEVQCSANRMLQDAQKVLNTAHQQAIYNLESKHRYELGKNRSECQRERTSESPMTSNTSDSILSAIDAMNSSNVLGNDSMESQTKTETKSRKCFECGGRGRYVRSYCFCSQSCSHKYYTKLVTPENANPDSACS